MYNKDDIDTVISANVQGGRNYLDIDDTSIMRIGCEELEFVVQTIINSRPSGNSTAVSGNFYVGKNNGTIHICMHDYSKPFQYQCSPGFQLKLDHLWNISP